MSTYSIARCVPKYDAEKPSIHAGSHPPLIPSMCANVSKCSIMSHSRGCYEPSVYAGSWTPENFSCSICTTGKFFRCGTISGELRRIPTKSCYRIPRPRVIPASPGWAVERQVRSGSLPIEDLAREIRFVGRDGGLRARRVIGISSHSHRDNIPVPPLDMMYPCVVYL